MREQKLSLAAKVQLQWVDDVLSVRTLPYPPDLCVDSSRFTYMCLHSINKITLSLSLAMSLF